MKNFILILIMLITALISCDKEDEKEDNLTNDQVTSIAGHYERDFNNDHFVMELKENAEFTITCDNYAMDPYYWYGTFELSSDSISFNQHEDFVGSTVLIIYNYELKEDNLTLKKDDLTIIWTKTD